MSESIIEIGAPAGVPQFYGHEMFEHYQQDGYLIVVTSDATAIRLEPGDFIVKRVWSTAVVPYVYNRAANTVTPPTETVEEVGTGAGEGASRQGAGSAWVTRSADCPEASAQAHLRDLPPTETEEGDR